MCLLQLLIAVYLLWDTLGVSVLAGVGSLVLLIPVNGCLAVRQQRLRKESLRWKDKRLKLVDETTGGMKVWVPSAGERASLPVEFCISGLLLLLWWLLMLRQPGMMMMMLMMLKLCA